MNIFGAYTHGDTHTLSFVLGSWAGRFAFSCGVIRAVLDLDGTYCCSLETIEHGVDSFI